MSRRITDRYSTAHDMAEELRLAATGSVRTPLLSSSDAPVGRPGIVPKGLRSFGPEDAEFFLRLLPGPHDREGLPEAIRFWKVRVESTDADTAFRVGLIHGPSGCGKTSLVRAGLLPRLAPHVTPIYLEALRDGTEARLQSKLHSAGVGQVSNLPSEQQTLAAAIAALRRGQGLENGRKILIVVDQLEQWLHARGGQPSPVAARLQSCPTADDLVAAMRQADGCHVQFLLMIRDDFWSASVRLFEELEIPMDNEKNARMVDLFDQAHARRVLEFFGQAYDCLPARSRDLSAAQNAFLDKVVAGLSQGGKVISVHLSLFADMMKARPWTLESLQAVGGTEGVGVRFLEETFSAASAHPEHRRDEKPARGLLAALLPEAGGDIKGRMCSREELFQASGLEDTPQRFERLLKGLSQELRIITPTEPVEQLPASGGVSPLIRVVIRGLTPPARPP